MQLFKWDETFQTGHAEVDEQHQQLVKIINQFGELLASNVSEKIDINKVCDDLMEYARHHFSEEERLMFLSGIDKRHVMYHCQQHQALVDEIVPLRQLVEVGDLEAGKYLFEFLVNWLVFHIFGTDMLMAKQIESVYEGESAERIYVDIEKNNSDVTGRLLTAVKALLHQISTRNRQLTELNESLELKVAERTKELSLLNENLHMLANTDSLTGLMNRRAFMDEANSMFDLAKRYHRQLSFLMLDVDYFKRINDTYGHQVGDYVLIKLGELIKKCLRSTDIVGRIGGEEFAVVLPETSFEQAVELIERLLKTIRDTTIVAEAPINITVSIGVASVPPSAPNIESIMKEADAALYKAKAEGRDRCCGALWL